METRNQANNKTWFIERINHLTASNFGKVCKMHSHTSCKSTVHHILYGNSHKNPMEYGKLSEELAIRKLEEYIQKYRLFINEEIHHYLHQHHVKI